MGRSKTVPRFRRWLGIGLMILILPATIPLALRGYSAWEAKGQIYSLEQVPERPVAIIFGAGYQNSILSPMLADRVKAGAALYQAGKVKALLLTGDNHVTTYNEPEVMRQYALTLGVPDSAIVLDYAGFHTYDSCYRARDIFKVDKAILITQAFHLDRALLICNSLGIESIGVAADAMRPEGYDLNTLKIYQVREVPSTTLSIVDLLCGVKPTFLGEPLPILASDPGKSAAVRPSI